MLLKSILDSRLSSHVLMSVLIVFTTRCACLCALGPGGFSMSQELREFFSSKGRTTSYNPTCNGQVERYNGIVWRRITMSLKSKNLQTEHWQLVRLDVLLSVYCN